MSAPPAVQPSSALTCGLLVQLRFTFLLNLLNDALVVLLQEHTSVADINIIFNKTHKTESGSCSV